MQVTSFGRPGKLFTADQSLIYKSVASLELSKFQEVISAIIAIIKPKTL
jgi:hypothetical protein